MTSGFILKARYPESLKMKLSKSARFREGEKLGKVTFPEVPISARWKDEKHALLKNAHFQFGSPGNGFERSTMG